MTTSETGEQIIKESAEAISGVMFKSMQMWEANDRFDEFTLPLVLLERVKVIDGSVGQNGFDTNKCTMLLYIFTGIILLNGYVEEKGPLVLAAETIKESLIKNIRNHALTHIEGDLPYHSEEIMESPLFTHNPCGVWVRITVPIRKRVC
jgi:hypothetical protein